MIALLARWRAGAIVISHDRELLETMDAIVELTSLGATRYGGNWSLYREQKALELSAARHDLADAEKRIAQVARSAQATAERKARKDSAGKKQSRKGGTPRILLGAMQDRSEASGGDNARLAERQRTQALEDAASARERIEILQPLAVVLPPTRLPRGKTVLTIDAMSAGYDPESLIIRDLSFAITGPERIAVTGPNGQARRHCSRSSPGCFHPWRGRFR